MMDGREDAIVKRDNLTDTLTEFAWQLHLAKRAVDGRPYTAPEVFVETAQNLLAVGDRLLCEIRESAGQVRRDALNEALEAISVVGNREEYHVLRKLRDEATA